MKLKWGTLGLLLIILLLAAMQVWISVQKSAGDISLGSPAFPAISLTNLSWRAKKGFDSQMTNGIPETASGVISLPVPAFPIHLNQLFNTPPGSGLQHYTLDTTFSLAAYDRISHLALYFHELGENWAIYLNGHLLRNEIFLDPSGQQMIIRRSLQDVILPLPNEYLFTTTNHLVFHMIGNADSIPFLTGWAPGFPLSEGYTLGLEADLVKQLAQKNAFAMLQIGAYLFFGLYMLIFYLNQTQEITNLLLSIFLIGFGAGWQFFNSSYGFGWVLDTSLITRFSYVTIILSGTLIPAIWFFFYPQAKVPLLIRLLLGYLAVACVSLLVAPFEWIEIILRSYLMILMIYIAFCAWVLWRAWHERLVDAGKLSFLIFCGTVLAGWDLIDVHWLHTGWMVSTQMPFLIAGLFSVIIVNRYWRLSKEREQIGQQLVLRNQDLERAQAELEGQVQQRTAQLLDEINQRVQAQQLSEARAIEAETLRQASAALTETLDRQEVIKHILDQLLRVVPYATASVQLKSPDGLSSIIVGGSGFHNANSVLGWQFPLNETNPTTQVYQTRKPYLLANRSLAQLRQIDHPDFEIQSWLCVPLLYQGEAIGVLSLDSYEPDHFNLRHADLVSAYAGSVVLAVHNSQVYEKIRRGADELSMFYEIGLNITSGLDMDSLLVKLYDAACRLAPVECFYMALVNEETQMVTFPIFMDNGESRQIEPQSIQSNDSMTTWIINHKRNLYIPEINRIPEELEIKIHHAGGPVSHSYVGVPLISRDRVLGVISLQSTEPNAYSPDHLRLFETLANQAVVAIENSRLFLQVQKELTLRQSAEDQLYQANQRLQAEISEVQRLQEVLREQAIRDSLTGLFNRRFMEETFTHELARAGRENLPIGIIILDIDKFKVVNDTYGHAAGDTALIALARLLTSRLRASDTACRYGGEEFLLLLPGLNLPSTYRRAEELRKAIAELSVPFQDIDLTITVSMGVASFPSHGREMDVLIRQADNNLYLAKNTGRNQVIG